MPDSLPGKGRPKTALLLAALLFCAAALPAGSQAATMLDNQWSAGTLYRTVSESGTLKLDYNFGTGRDGAFSGTFLSAPTAKVTSFIGTDTVSLATAPPFSVGNEVMLINMRGTPYDASNVGKYEFLEVRAITGYNVQFTTPIRQVYGDPGSQVILLQKVLHYSDVVVSGTLSAPPFDDNPGSPSSGIIAFRVSGTLTLGGTISADGLGYRGGSPTTDGDGPGAAAQQGESYTGWGGRSNGANGGGGGGGFKGVYDAGTLSGALFQSGGGGGGRTSAGTNGGVSSSYSSYAGMGGSANGALLGSGGGGGGQGQYIPAPPPEPGSTPYISVWNGKEYVTENDILFGYPISFRSDYFEAKSMYESGASYSVSDGQHFARIEMKDAYERGDTYKLQLPFVPKDGKYSFLISEHDPEESFMDEIKLYKIIHDEGTEIFVKSDLSGIYALDTSETKKPESCITSKGETCLQTISNPEAQGDALLLDRGDYLDINFAYPEFPSPKIVVRAKHREDPAKAVYEPERKDAFSEMASQLERLLDPVPSVNADRSIWVFYHGPGGEWKPMGVIHPRDLNYANEILEISPEAMETFRQEGMLRLRLLWTGLHSLGFIGLVESDERGFTKEELPLLRAYHHRLGHDFRSQLSEKDFDYMHTIQGDVVEAEFGKDNPTPAGKKASFIVATEGFYTDLRAYLYPGVDFDYYQRFWNPQTPEEAKAYVSLSEAAPEYQNVQDSLPEGSVYSLSPANGGAGGRGAGAVVIYARNIIGSGYITARGAAGGAGYRRSSEYYVSACGGGGGAGGTILVRTLSSSYPNTAYGGGAGGSGANSPNNYCCSSSWLGCNNYCPVYGYNGGGGGAGSFNQYGPERFPYGYFISRVFTSSFPQGSKWNSMSVSSTGSQITAYYHACGNADCSDKAGQWAACASLSSCAIGQEGMYFQYRLDLGTANLQYTPSVSSVSIDYQALDNTGPAVAITGAPSGWANTDRTATISCTDTESGCNSQSYRFRTYASSPPSACPQDFNLYTPTNPVSSTLPVASQTWVCGAARDNVGNWGYSITPANFSIDKDTPTAGVGGEPASWVNSSTLTFSCSDSLSGCSPTAYHTFVPSSSFACLTGGTATNSGFLDVSSDHNDYLCLRVSDRAGNVHTDMSSQLWVDATLPSTTDDSRTDWYGSPADVRLTCADSLSGCNRTYYCTADCTSPTQCGTCTPLTASSSEETTVQISCLQNCYRKVFYYSLDKAGNRESAKSSRVIQIDVSLPTCRMTSPTSAYTTSGQINVSWQASSLGSPVSSVTVEKKEGMGAFEAWLSQQAASGTQAISSPANGQTYSFRCKARNQMGVEGGYSSEAGTTVDTGLPTATISVPKAIVNATTFLVSWSGDDSETGVNNYTVSYKTGSGTYSQWGAFQPASTSGLFGQDGLPVTPQNNNTYTFKVRVSDKAGNSRESGEAWVLVDTNKPGCAIQGMQAYQPTNDFTVSWSGLEGESGIREYVVEQRAGADAWTEWYRGSGTSKEALSAQDGLYRFRCRATDSAGNTGDASAEKNTTVDINPPDMQVSYNSSVFVNDSLQIKATVTDATKVSSVTLYYNSTLVPETELARTPNLSSWDLKWTISSLLLPGSHSFTISAADASGKSQNRTFSFIVKLCDEGVQQKCGVCQSGTKTCRSGVFTECVGEDKTLLKQEVCNGLDDDCNSMVDDINHGNSVLQTQCACYGQSLLAAKQEECNGIDDDCDSQIDEGTNCCNEGDTQQCGSDMGICRNRKKACTDSKWGPCQWEYGPDPQGEICGNGLDDDCDGQTDENCQQCTDTDRDGNGYPASSLCRYPEEDCDDSDPNIYPGGTEICNGLDDDCDGQADDGLSCDHCTNGELDSDEEGTDCGGEDCPACFVWGWLFLTAGGVVIIIIILVVWLHFRGEGRELTWEELKRKWSFK